MSDQSPGEGWWQATDGNWYPPDQPPGPGWWKASDGNWYPPESAPAQPAVAPPAPPAQPPAAQPSAAQPPVAKGRSKLPLVALAIVAVLAVVAGVLVFTGGDDGSGDGPSANGGQNGDNGGSASGDGPLVGGPDEEPDSAITLQPEVVVVSGNEGATLREIRDDGETLVLDASAAGAADLAAGDILLLTGLTVVSVVDVEPQGDDLVVTAGPANLVDVIADGELDWSDMVVDPADARIIIGEPEMYDDDGNAWGGEAGIVSAGESASALLFPVPNQAMSGRIADFNFVLDYGPQGSGHRLGLSLEGTGNLKGTIDVNTVFSQLSHGGRAVVVGGETESFDWQIEDFTGEAEIKVTLASLEQLTSVNTPRFLRVPFSIEWVMPVGGIPFKFSLGATIEVRLSFSLADSSLQGRAAVTFGGPAGFQWAGGDLTVAGQQVATIEDTFSALAGAAGGPVGVVFTVEAPKMTFGLGIAKTGVGVFVSSGMVTSQFLAGSASAIPCTAVAMAYVLAAGVDAQFLGYQWDIVRKAIVDERWERYAPQHPSCAP